MKSSIVPSLRIIRHLLGPNKSLVWTIPLSIHCSRSVCPSIHLLNHIGRFAPEGPSDHMFSSCPPPPLSLSDTKCSSKAVYKIFCWPSKSCNSLQTVIKCQPLSGAWLTSLWKTQVSSTPTPIFLAQKCLHPLSRFKNIPSPHLFFSDLSPKSLIRQCFLWDMCVCVCENDGEGVFQTSQQGCSAPLGPHTHTHTSHTLWG